MLRGVEWMSRPALVQAARHRRAKPAVATGDAGVSTAVGLRIITGLFSLGAATEAVAVVGVSVSRERWRESLAVKGNLSARVVTCPQSQAPLVSATPISTPIAIPRTG